MRFLIRYDFFRMVRCCTPFSCSHLFTPDVHFLCVNKLSFRYVLIETSPKYRIHEVVTDHFLLHRKHRGIHLWCRYCHVKYIYHHWFRFLLIILTEPQAIIWRWPLFSRLFSFLQCIMVSVYCGNCELHWYAYICGPSWVCDLWRLRNLPNEIFTTFARNFLLLILFRTYVLFHTYVPMFVLIYVTSSFIRSNINEHMDFIQSFVIHSLFHTRFTVIN